MGTITFQTITPIDLEKASQEKKVLVQQIADSAASPRPFHREMRFLREMPKDLYHLYQMNKLNCISEGYTGTGHLSICTTPVPTCTTYTRGKASSKLAETAICKVKGDLRSQNLLFLAGLRGQMLGSVKATETGIAEVTVSMTSGNSTGYVNLSSPELGSAKYRQRRSTKPEVTVTSRNAINALAPASLGVCPDNLLNRKAESEFVQASGKEKGPAGSQALLSTSMISCTGESNELHHNWHLQATGNLAYSRHQHPNKTGAGFDSPIHEADIRRYKRFFFVRYNQRCAPIMVGRSGGALALAGFFVAGLSIPLRLATLFDSRERGLKEPTKEATTMATTQTRPEFIDTYWIIPEYSSAPYGKVSFTRQDRRTFIAMFKDSRLIWAGRQPVQGRVKITPPSVITNIVTVQGVAHV